MKQNQQSRNGQRNEHSTAGDGVATGNGAGRSNGPGGGDPILAALLAKADAMRGMIDTRRDSARADLFAAMAMAELSATAETDVLRRIRGATGANMAELRSDYRRIKGTNANTVTKDKVLDMLAARLIYVQRQHRWLDTETGLLLDEPRLRMLAQRLGVGGAMLSGSHSVAARLGRANSGMRQAVSLTMRPGAGEIVVERGQPHANTWRPSELLPLKGATAADAEPWLRHVERLIPDADDRRRVLDRLAWILQNPGKKTNSALVLLGPQGAGKDTLLLPLWAGVGEENVGQVSGSKVGQQFNGYFQKQLLLITEMPPVHKRDSYEDIKGALATPPDHIAINLKGIEAFTVPNVVNVFVTTNHAGAIALAEDDRRFDVVSTVKAAEQANTAYWMSLHKWLANGGNEAVVGYLLSRDVSAFIPSVAPPMTAAKRMMAREGAHPAVAWVMSLWDPGGPLADRDTLTANEILDKGQAGKWGAGHAIARNIVATHVAQALRMVPERWTHSDVQVRDGDGRPRPWLRTGRLELLMALSVQGLQDHLKSDRAKSSEYF